MKKGFTLIELLAVITILGLIGLIAIPSITKVLKNSKEKLYQSQVKMIEQNGKKWAVENVNKISETETVHLNLSELINSGYIEQKELSDPRNSKQTMNGCIIIQYNSEYSKYEYSYDEKTCYEIDPIYANKPELTTGMIPVKWYNGNWVKADTNNKDGDNQWYDYNNQMWANVVLVTESTRNTYKDASAGVIINESDVLAYLVWVPRYKYKLFNVEALAISPRAIDIIFENKNVTKSNGSSNETWLTHPAFTFGTSEVNGIWVGKFETSTNDTTCNTTPNETNCKNVNPLVKPNVPSLRWQNVSTQFATAQKFNNTTTYGTTSDFDSHMMKSMEWGAVTYLSHSIYGRKSEIYINPSSNYITGRGGNTVSQENTADTLGSASNTLYSYDGKQCNTKNGFVCTGTSQSVYGMTSSTTGNIYGIYDMSGGAHEYVMGAIYNSGSTTVMVGSSGFAQATIDDVNMAKYINKYAEGTTNKDQTAYDRRQLGDATGETRNWYSDYASFVSATGPWFLRGGVFDYFTVSGGFYLSTNYGKAAGEYSFRFVQLKP